MLIGPLSICVHVYVIIDTVLTAWDGLYSYGVRLQVVVTLYMYGLVSPGVRLQVVVTLYMYGLVSPGVRLQVVVTLEVFSLPNIECILMYPTRHGIRS